MGLFPCDLPSPVRKDGLVMEYLLIAILHGGMAILLIKVVRDVGKDM